MPRIFSKRTNPSSNFFLKRRLRSVKKDKDKQHNRTGSGVFPPAERAFARNPYLIGTPEICPPVGLFDPRIITKIHLYGCRGVICIESTGGLCSAATIEHGDGDEDGEPVTSILSAFGTLGWYGVGEDGEYPGTEVCPDLGEFSETRRSRHDFPC